MPKILSIPFQSINNIALYAIKNGRSSFWKILLCSFRLFAEISQYHSTLWNQRRRSYFLKILFLSIVPSPKIFFWLIWLDKRNRDSEFLKWVRTNASKAPDNNQTTTRSRYLVATLISNITSWFLLWKETNKNTRKAANISYALA